MRMTPDGEESIRCTVSSCSCVCFKPGSVQLRSCDRCGHGWVAHALEKLYLQAQQPSTCRPVEVALPGLVFDLSSLVLYGAQAIPVRLKILLDRLYSILTPEQVSHILHTLGWCLGDYVRGYMLQFPSGKVLDRWVMVTPEEELLIHKQFLRFGETRPIVELMTVQCLAAVSHPSSTELSPTLKRRQSNISTFIEQNSGTPGMLRGTRGDPPSVLGVCSVDQDDTVHHLGNCPGGRSLLLPFHLPSSDRHCPSTKELVSDSKLKQSLQKPKMMEKRRQEGGRREQENNLILSKSKGEPALKIKADPDKLNPVLPVWHQDPRYDKDQELDLHRGTAKQENTSWLLPSLNSSLNPTSFSLHPSVSSSPAKTSQKLQSSSSYSLSPLPVLSSSFLCPLPTSSFSSFLNPLPSASSSLYPLPSSLCSHPSLSPAGSRKGRVCCGVCGKSFYDKGTLKIHYNAVHLKIKHRCTVAGCTMVFSSLRSRNRHSANPNPRLHTGTSRDTHTNGHTHTDPCTSVHSEIQPHKDKTTSRNIHNAHTHTCGGKDIGKSPWRQDSAHKMVRAHTLRNGLNGHVNPQHGCQDNTPPQADSPPPSPHSVPWTLSQETNQNLPLRDTTYGSDTQPLTLPPPPLLPACSDASTGSPPSFAPRIVPAPAPLPNLNPMRGASFNSRPRSCDCGVTEGKRTGPCTSPPTNQQWQWESGEPVPKKKPRKSSMPVKIERETAEQGGSKEEECLRSAAFY